MIGEIEKPDGAEIFHEGLWFKKSNDGGAGYALYWHPDKEVWKESASVSNLTVAFLIGAVKKAIPAVDMKFDHDKPRYDLLPPVAIDEMAKVMTFGAKKYEPNSWRNVANAESRYLAAALRHAFAIARGEINDPETGLPHAAHLMCDAAFLTELQHGRS
jgi:hypothetical protein